MSQAIANNNGAAALTANGNFCQIATWQPSGTQPPAVACNLLTNVTYTLVNATATGTITFQELGLDGVWRNMATPAPISLSSATVNGTISGAYHGIRANLSALAISTVTYLELRGTVLP